jgi:hypothetical protein
LTKKKFPHQLHFPTSTWHQQAYVEEDAQIALEDACDLLDEA